LTYDDIVILTCRGVANSVFSEREKVGAVKLRRFTGGYDLFGNQVLTDGRLTFDSVFRFKGQEAPAVILADVDPDPKKRERDARLLYCGMTRATVRLELLVNETNPDCRRFL
ncbi:MAG TPA: ATP-binding domain-containing protein, partial [Opitutaceae bacterium]